MASAAATSAVMAVKERVLRPVVEVEIVLLTYRRFSEFR